MVWMVYMNISESSNKIKAFQSINPPLPIHVYSLVLICGIILGKWVMVIIIKIIASLWVLRRQQK